jgi:hypothetical protein
LNIKIKIVKSAKFNVKKLMYCNFVAIDGVMNNQLDKDVHIEGCVRMESEILRTLHKIIIPNQI